jgi:hypothetical protein
VEECKPLAMGYNFMAIPLAAGVLFPRTHIQMPPWVAGAAMVRRPGSCPPRHKVLWADFGISPG